MQGEVSHLRLSVSPDAWFTRLFGTGIWPFARRAGGRSGSYSDDLFLIFRSFWNVSRY